MLSQTKRKKGGIPFRLTERDIDILKAVNRYRYLRTVQVQRLVFAENGSIQSARRRLRLLFHNGYLGRIHPFLQQGNKEQSADIAYYLGKVGQEALDELGETVFRYSKANQVRHKFLLHALDLSEFRLNLELALIGEARLALRRFIPYFDMKEGVTSVTGKNRYRLFDKIRDPLTGRDIVIYPDAALILETVPGAKKRLLFAEIDRGTEGLERIREKLFGYQLYMKNRVFAKYGSFDRFTVLFQTTSDRRALNMASLAQSMTLDFNLFVTGFENVSPESLLHGEIWMERDGNRRALLQG